MIQIMKQIYREEMVSKCSVEDCNRPKHANGYCNMHDRRNKRNGSPELQPKFTRLCTICLKKAVGRGFCQTHLRRYQVWGDPMKVGSTKGIKFTQDHRNKLRDKKLGVNNPNYGKHRPCEVIEKIKNSNLGLKRDEQTKSNISKSQKERFKNKEDHPMFGKHQTEKSKDKCRESWTPELRDRMAIKASNQVKNYKNTDCEIKLQKLLSDANISYITQKAFKVNNRLHNVDIFIEPNICIEADGEYWHNLEKNKKRDQIVNEQLTKQGLIVLRFWRKQILNSPESCINKIKQTVAWGDHSL